MRKARRSHPEHALALRRDAWACPMRASRRWSTRWWARRCRSSRTRCRRRGRWCAASSSRTTRRWCWSTRPASSRRARATAGSSMSAMVRTAWGGAGGRGRGVPARRRAKRAGRGAGRGERGARRQGPAPTPAGRAMLVAQQDRHACPAPRLLAVVARAERGGLPFEETFLVSALDGRRRGGPAARHLVKARRRARARGSTRAISSPTCPMRQLAAEVTREKLMLRLHEELPYQIACRDREGGRPCARARCASSRRSTCSRDGPQEDRRGRQAAPR